MLILFCPTGGCGFGVSCSGSSCLKEPKKLTDTHKHADTHTHKRAQKQQTIDDSGGILPQHLLRSYMSLKPKPNLLGQLSSSVPQQRRAKTAAMTSFEPLQALGRKRRSLFIVATLHTLLWL